MRRNQRRSYKKLIDYGATLIRGQYLLLSTDKAVFLTDPQFLSLPALDI